MYYYEPSDDTFLLLDAILNSFKPLNDEVLNICEIGYIVLIIVELVLEQ